MKSNKSGIVKNVTTKKSESKVSVNPCTSESMEKVETKKSRSKVSVNPCRSAIIRNPEVKRSKIKVKQFTRYRHVVFILVILLLTEMISLVK